MTGLVRYGYHGLNAMVCLLQEEAELELYRNYTAQCLWGIDRATMHWIGAKSTMPEYVDIAYPKKQDKRTANEIISHVLEGLR